MEINNYTPQDIVQKNIGFTFDTVTLSKADTAAQILPPDTQFAVVIEAIERAAGESFDEIDTTTVGLAATATMGSEGMRGRFVGYAAISPGVLRIYNGNQLIFEEQLSNVQAELRYGCFVSNASKTYKILEIYAINGAQFASNANGLNGGYNPFLDALQTGGVMVQRPSQTQSKAVAIILILFFIGVGLAVILFGHGQK